MCGLFGMIRKSYSYTTSASDKAKLQKNIEAIKHMGILSQSRGTDSTGIVRVSVNEPAMSFAKKVGKIDIYKDRLPAKEFFETKNAKGILDKVDNHTTAVLGHTRAGTSANPFYNTNNHPHVCGNIIGMHNGHIRNWVNLAIKFKLKLNGRCDSEVIFGLLNKFMAEKGMSIEEATKEVSSLLEGSFACVAVDTEDCSSVMVFRRSNPLAFRYSSSVGAVLFASEAAFVMSVYQQIFKPKNKASWYFEMDQMVMPDNHGFHFRPQAKTATDWFQETEPFKLT